MKKVAKKMVVIEENTVTYMNPKKRLIILYTSDIHGQLNATNYASKNNDVCGLTRLASYLTKLKDEFILLDNGDSLQGSPLLDYARLFLPIHQHPLPHIFNMVGYHYYTLGNHDFNYGMDYLTSIIKQIKATLICANITTKDHKRLFQPYVIHQTSDHLRVGIIGVVTQYIPHWEQKEHIENLLFQDAYESVKEILPEVQKQADVIIVLYHGGYERNMQTQVPHGRPTDENQGYLISRLPGVHVLLTGHQHVPQVHQTPSGITLQTGLNARDFGEVVIEYEVHSNHFVLTNLNGQILANTFPEEKAVASLLEPLEQNVNPWLDQELGHTPMNFLIQDPLSCRIQKHPLFQLINHVQLEHTHADISCSSLPNHPPGFSKVITRREIMANFIYPNTLVKLQISGKILKSALEKNAQYFDVIENQLCVHSSYIHPKLEHYNYDVYDGIEYTMDIRNPVGSRIISLKHNNQDIKENDEFTLVLNNYRASGGGDFEMFQEATIVDEYEISLATLMTEYIENHPNLEFDLISNFSINY